MWPVRLSPFPSLTLTTSLQTCCSVYPRLTFNSVALTWLGEA